MFYLVALNPQTLEIRILDTIDKKEDILKLLGSYLKATKGTLAEGPQDFLNEGVHVKEIEEQKEYHIFKTVNNGIIRNTFYSEHVLTYKIVEYLTPSVKVALPPVKSLKDVLQAGKADFNNELFF